MKLSSACLCLLVVAAGCATPRWAGGSAPADPLPSWNDGPAKAAIVNFVRTTIDESNPKFVPLEDRIATFDQDGTIWVEHPAYSQLLFAFDRVAALAPQHPEWKARQPFQAVLEGDKDAMGRFTLKDLETIVLATHAGMTTEKFQSIVRDWMATAKHPRFNQPYSRTVYQPMLELMRYFRANGYRTCIVTGGGQAFVRAYSQQFYGIPPEQVIGSALATKYEYSQDGQAILMREPKLLLDNNFSGKAEDIYLFLGRRPRAAFGNSTGDREMLEYAQGGEGSSLEMLVLHDDAVREYAYGPAEGLPDTKAGTFTQGLFDEAGKKGWTVISMKNDWKRIFPPGAG
ncbi:MAG TPA: HAD family hydrolase [Bryobacteraceae bacterium]